MSILKDFRFTVDVKGNAERVVETTTEEGLALSVATPPEFRGGIHGMWSPEHLLVSAVVVVLCPDARRSRGSPTDSVVRRCNPRCRSHHAPRRRAVRIRRRRAGRRDHDSRGIRGQCSQGVTRSKVRLHHRAGADDSRRNRARGPSGRSYAGLKTFFCGRVDPAVGSPVLWRGNSRPLVPASRALALRETRRRFSVLADGRRAR